jgi:hypothetical protein
MFCAPILGFGGSAGIDSCFHVLHVRNHFRRYRGRRVQFSCFARPDPFSAVPRVSALVFMFCPSGLVFSDTEGVGSRFQYLRAPTHFRLYRGHRLLITCFARPDSFSVVSIASCPIFMFCAPGLIFGGTERVVSRIIVLRARTHFRRYRVRRVSFSCFTRPESFFAVPRESAPVFMFYAPGIVFGGTEGVGPHFHVLHARTRFLRYRGSRLPFSCFKRPK